MRPYAKCLMLVIGLGSIGCGSNLPDVDCSGDIPQFADVTALQKCSTCHSSQHNGATRNGAPSSVNYDTESAARSKAEDGASEVNGGDMPPKSSGVTLSDAEKQAFYKWALCK